MPSRRDTVQNIEARSASALPEVNRKSKRRQLAAYKHPTAETEPDTFWLKERIAEKGMSQRFLAKACGLDESKFSRILTGDRKVELPEIITLAGLLDVSFEKLLAKMGYPSKAKMLRRLRD